MNILITVLLLQFASAHKSSLQISVRVINNKFNSPVITMTKEAGENVMTINY